MSYTIYGCNANRMFSYGESCADALNSLYQHFQIDTINNVGKAEIILIEQFNQDLYQAIEEARQLLISILKSKNENKKINTFEDVIIVLFSYIKKQLTCIFNKVKTFYQYNFDIGIKSINFDTCYRNYTNSMGANTSVSIWPILFLNNEL